MAAKETAIDLLRSIDVSLKRLVLATERKSERQASYRRKQERDDGPCRACPLTGKCISACKDKDEWDNR